MIFLAVTENKFRFAWETKVYLTNLREFNYSKDAHILVFLNTPIKLKEWEQLEIDFPEVTFTYFPDKYITNIARAFNYPPIHRFYCLQEYWKQNKWLETTPVFYTDTDIIFTKRLDFSNFLNDSYNYVSWTGDINRISNYLDVKYLESKIHQVEPDKLDRYKKLDIVARLGNICGLNKEILLEKDPYTGGAQYLLKNITGQFWTDCFNTCCEIKTFLSNINQTFMKGKNPQEKEDNGFQSWCADMWALLYNLWKVADTRVPVEFDFAWSTDLISRADEVYILHNAGVTTDEKIRIANSKDSNGISKEIDAPVFFKGKPTYEYIAPWEDTSLITIYNNDLNKKFCNNLYIKKILNCKI